MGKVSGAQFDANALAAMSAFFTRTGISAVETDTPFLQLIRGESDDAAVRGKLAGLMARYRELCEAAERSQGKAEADAVRAFYARHEDDLNLAVAMDSGHVATVSEMDILQRMEGVRIFFRYLTQRGWHPAQMMKQVIAVGRALHVSPFAEMDMTEIANLTSDGKAAHSHRCKILSGEIKRAGGRGVRLPAQKTESAGKTYKRIRKRNTCRKGGKKFIQNKTKTQKP